MAFLASRRLRYIDLTGAAMAGLLAFVAATTSILWPTISRDWSNNLIFARSRWSASRWVAARWSGACRGTAAAAFARVVLIAPVTQSLLKTEDNPDGVAGSNFEGVRQVL